MWFRRRKQNLMVTGRCHACGACCRDLILVDADRPLRSRGEFRRLLARQPQFTMFRPQASGTQSGLLRFRCERLADDGRCTAYRRRPAVCRRYPDPAMFAHGAELPDGCGYRLVPRRDFAELLERERRRRGRRGWRRLLPIF